MPPGALITTFARRRPVLATALLTVSLLAAGCGGKDKESAKTEAGTDQSLAALGLTAKDGESGLEDAGKPKRGGKLIYGLEADSNGGFCLSEGQLAISGMMVVRAIYDTLTVPNAEGGYTPYLAKAVTPNDDFTEWNIELREGITFHDGSPLTADVVKNNLDAYRGTYPARSSLLFAFVLKNIASTEVTGPLTVKVTTTVPWVGFPAFLYSSSRMGMMAQAQLDDPNTCARKPIGTGPFEFVSWTKNQKLVAERNPDYWQIAPDGKPYPYADSIEFRPVVDAGVRNRALEAGDLNIMHSSAAIHIGGKLNDLRKDGKVNMYVSEEVGEIGFVMLNATKPPFDDIRMRKALALGVDRKRLNDVVNGGHPTLANGPFAPGSVGHLEDSGFPGYDLEAAKKLVKEYVADGGKAQFSYTTGADALLQQFAELLQQQMKKLGLTMKIVNRDQTAGINDAIGKKYEAMLFRNFPGGDPDQNHVWWYGKGNPVNFFGFEDEEMNTLLDEGRSEPDPAKRKKIYEDINRLFAKQLYAVWTTYTPWAIVESANVHNVLGPPLPGDDITKPGKASTDDPAQQPTVGLATGHSLLGLWIDE